MSRLTGFLAAFHAAFLAAAALAWPLHAAEPSWPDLQAALYGDRFLTPGDGVVAIDAPYRTFDDARTGIGAVIEAPDGLMIESVTLILDENPAPVSAVFTLDAPVRSFAFDVTMRVNGPTPVHVVTKTTNGQLFVSEAFVKTSGTGACAAPPGTDPVEALATLGRMRLGLTAPTALASLASLTGETRAADRMLTIDIDHPSHSGMQMDQISLLYIPLRHVETVAVELDERPFATITGSISLSENPSISISVPDHAAAVAVKMADTDGAAFETRETAAGL